MLRIHGVILLVIGSLLLVGLKSRFAALFAALMLLSIIFPMLIESGISEILIRDVGLLGLAVSLAFDKTKAYSIDALI